jgi:SAM-dependent methyltransferase
LVRGVLSQAPHDQANGCCEDWAQVFDRAARVSPEAAVAVYALGRADLMARATASIAQRLKQWGLLQPAGSVLDLGCGVGRLVHAIASEVAVVAGLDVSQEMLTAARRRCAGLPNALFLHGSGRDLSPLADSAFDLIAAVDVFPYVVSCGTEMAACHLAECHRVLKSSRSLLILNYAYGRSYSEEAEELGRLSDSTGFDLVRIGSGDFDLWDGRTFHLVRR